MARDTSAETRNVSFVIGDNRIAVRLFGENNQHLRMIEDALGVQIADRGNTLLIDGPEKGVVRAEAVLRALQDQLEKRRDVGPDEVRAALRFSGLPRKKSDDSEHPAPGLKALNEDSLVIQTRRKAITPRTPKQAEFIRAIRDQDLVFGLGPAGTGKTYLAVAVGVLLFLEGEVERMIFCRPAVEAGERLGFLPGDLKEKVDPYLRPIYDALYDMMPAEMLDKYLKEGRIEVAPLAYMRGRTLANAFVILDEAQNTTDVQMKMFLTRLGENARMVVNGDPSQVDLQPGQTSGLRHALAILDGVPGIEIVTFTEKDVVRHPLVNRIVRAYDSHDKKSSPPRYTRHARDDD